MRELWDTGRSDLKGDFFQMDDCRCLPMPSARIPIICAGQSDAGTRFASQYCDYNFCSGGQVNQPLAATESVARLVAANAETGRDCGALLLQMVIADETDEAAFAKWEHYKAGTDFEAIAWRDAQAEDDPNRDPYSQPLRRKTLGVDKLPTNQGVFVGSYASVARMLDDMATVPGVRGVMLTFDDFLIGMEQFGQRIQPLMKCRAKALAA
jgi:pyrimidine oxygenase